MRAQIHFVGETAKELAEAGWETLSLAVRAAAIELAMSADDDYVATWHRVFSSPESLLEELLRYRDDRFGMPMGYPSAGPRFRVSVSIPPAWREHWPAMSCNDRSRLANIAMSRWLASEAGRVLLGRQTKPARRTEEDYHSRF